VRGRLIVFEGLDGVGKTTQARLLAEYLQEQEGIPCVYAKQPGQVFEGKLRELILTQTATPLAELFLFLADRHQHVTQVVKPLLAAGQWVVLDRYSDSTVAYQWYGRSEAAFKAAFDNDLPHFLRVVAAAEERLEPDALVLLDAPEPVIAARLARRAETTRLGEAAGAEFRKNLRAYYKHVMPYIRRYPVLPVRCEADIPAVHAQVVSVLLDHFKLRSLATPDDGPE
jgi:dTMP kinase